MQTFVQDQLQESSEDYSTVVCAYNFGGLFTLGAYTRQALIQDPYLVLKSYFKTPWAYTRLARIQYPTQQYVEYGST